jgi:3'-5' exoribonuclease 1
MVDESPTFPEVLKKLETWMDSHGLREEDGKVVEGLVNAVWVTDGVSAAQSTSSLPGAGNIS